MEISYTTTPADLKRLTNFQLTRINARLGTFARVGCGGFGIVIPLLVAGYFLNLYRQDHESFHLYFVVAMLWSWIPASLKSLAAWWKAKRNPAAMIETIRISPEALVHTINGQETIVKWGGGVTVGDDAGGVYFLTKSEVGDTVVTAESKRQKDYIVPVRAFQSPEQMRAFVEAAQSYREAASSVVQTGPAPGGISFNLTAEDMLHFNDYWTRRKKPFHAWRKWIPVALIVASTGYIAVVYWHLYSDMRMYGSHFDLFMLIPMMIPLIVLPLLFIPNSKSFKLKQFRVYPGMIDRASVSLTPEHFVRETAREQISLPWSVITDIAIDGQLIYFFPREQKGFYVPLQAFASPSMAQEFHARAVRLWKGEGGAPDGNSSEGIWPPPPQISSPDKADIG